MGNFGEIRMKEKLFPKFGKLVGSFPPITGNFLGFTIRKIVPDQGNYWEIE